MKTIPISQATNEDLRATFMLHPSSDCAAECLAEYIRRHGRLQPYEQAAIDRAKKAGR